MVDSNDRDRVVEARDELHRMLNEVLFEFRGRWNVVVVSDVGDRATKGASVCGV